MENEFGPLLERIREGDENAFPELLEQYGNLVEGAVRRFSQSFEKEGADAELYDPDDLRQMAAVALYKAAVTYRPEEEGQNVSFGLYAKICVNNALISALRKCRTQRKRREAEADAEKLRRANRNPSDPLQTMIAREGAAEAVRQIREFLSGYEKEVFELYLAGKSVGDIAERLNRDEKSVSNALYRMKVKIRGLLKME